MARPKAPEGRRAKETREARAKTRRHVTLGALALLALVVVVLVAMRPQELPPLEAGEGDPTLGSATAPVTVYYFEDYQCPHCREFETGGGLDALVDKHVDTGNARLVVKDFPILGEDSWTAAQASRYVWDAAPQRYWDWHRGLFEMQGPERSGWASAENLVAYTRASFPDINADGLAGALAAGTYRDEVQATLDEGEERGVRSTPTLLIAGRTVRANDAAAVESAIQAALADAEGST